MLGAHNDPTTLGHKRVAVLCKRIERPARPEIIVLRAAATVKQVKNCIYVLGLPRGLKNP
jgi:hypothetical protein